ncbi:MAG TPA: hypothetical protein PK129_13960 [Cellvibrionaceae bacterium]|nr:hypothetical protein [Cellvibrionaceae bacterium]
MKQIVKVIFLLVLTFAELAINARCVAADEPAVNFEQVNFVFVVGPDGYRGFSRGLTNDHVREAYINTYGLIYKNAKGAHLSLHNDSPTPNTYLYEMYLIGEGGAKKIYLTDRGLDDGNSWIDMDANDHNNLVQLIKAKKTFHFMGFTDDLKAKKEDVVERAINVFGSKLGDHAIADFSVFKAEYEYYLETKAREGMRATKVEEHTGVQPTQAALTNPSQREETNLATPDKASTNAIDPPLGNKSVSEASEAISILNQDESVSDAESSRYWLGLLIGAVIISIAGLIAYKFVNR